MYPWILSRVVNWVKSCGQFSVEFEERSEATLVFVRTWDRDTFRRVCVAVLCKYSGEAIRDAAIIGQLLSVVGPSVSVVSLVGGSHSLRDTYIDFAGSGYREKLVEYPIWLLSKNTIVMSYAFYPNLCCFTATPEWSVSTNQSINTFISPPFLYTISIDPISAQLVKIYATSCIRYGIVCNLCDATIVFLL